jgi:hypothetical protein
VTDQEKLAVAILKAIESPGSIYTNSAGTLQVRTPYGRVSLYQGTTELSNVDVRMPRDLQDSLYRDVLGAWLREKMNEQRQQLLRVEVVKPSWWVRAWRWLTTW